MLVSNNGVRLRPAPSLGNKEIRYLIKGEQVTRYAQPMVLADGFHWYRVTASMGNSGWSADPINGVPSFTAVTVPETWATRLDAPYVSQTSATAAKSNNDCGIASLLMQIRYWMKQHALVVPSLPSVDDLFKYTALAKTPPPIGLTFLQLELLARQLGFPTKYTQPATMDWITQQLRDDQPVMVLVDYAVFYPSAGQKIAHLAIVSAYNSTHFLTQDPYLAGANYRISRAQLENAMRSSPGNNLGFQAMTLA